LRKKNSTTHRIRPYTRDINPLKGARHNRQQSVNTQQGSQQIVNSFFQKSITKNFFESKESSNTGVSLRSKSASRTRPTTEHVVSVLDINANTHRQNESIDIDDNGETPVMGGRHKKTKSHYTKLENWLNTKKRRKTIDNSFNQVVDGAADQRNLTKNPNLQT
jgi:hypothetical protein